MDQSGVMAQLANIGAATLRCEDEGWAVLANGHRIERTVVFLFKEEATDR